MIVHGQCISLSRLQAVRPQHWQHSQDDFRSQQGVTLYVHTLAQCMLDKSSVSSSCSRLNDATIEDQYLLVV